MQRSSTYVYYSCKGGLSAAEDFYRSKLSALGWQEIPSSTPATEHYVDRLYTKDGYYLRASLSVVGQPDEVGVMLASLGNIDVRNLPKLSDAESTFPATPVNVTYQTQKSIPDAADEIATMLTEQGWQPWKEFQDNPVSVPHYRDLHYRKEACRLLVGIVRNPQNPADKTSVSYISEYVTPFDVPMLSAGQTLKLDLYSNRASFEVNSSRADLIKLLQHNSQRYDWTIDRADKFEASEEHMLPIHVKSGAYLTARLVESGGKYSASLEAFATAPKPKSPDTQSMAEREPPARPTATPANSADGTFQAIESDINSAIQSEVAKALGSLGKTNEMSPKNLAELESKAKELQSMFSKDALNDSGSETTEESANPFDVPEDTDAPSIEYQTIQEPLCKVTFKGKTVELKYAACYVMNEYDEATKCVLFSDRPIDQNKLQQLLLKKGESIYGMDVSPDASYLFDFHIRKESVSLNAKLESFSLGMSTSKIASDIRYYNGRLTGKLQSKETLSVGENELTVSAELNQATVKVDWASREKNQD